MLPSVGVISVAMAVLSAWGAPFPRPGPAGQAESAQGEAAGTASQPAKAIFGYDTESADQSHVDKEIVRRIIRRNLADVKHCYERELTKRPGLSGRVKVQMAIDDGGKVVRSSLQDSSMDSPPVETCIVDAVRGWAFPKPLGGGMVLVSYPFILTPAGAGGADEVAISALLGPGAVAPDLTAVAHDGQTITLSKLRGTQVVLYFYPKDDTPGCTKEACEFRDRWGDLKKAGVLVFGVSTQDNTSHKAFAQKFALPFPLIPDEKGELAAKYFVPVVNGKAQRITYLIGKDGRIQHVWPKVDPVGHAQDILNHLGAR